MITIDEYRKLKADDRIPGISSDLSKSNLTFSISDYKKLKAEGKTPWNTDSLNKSIDEVRSYISSVSNQSQFKGNQWTDDEYNNNRAQAAGMRNRLRGLQTYANSLKGKDEDAYNNAIDIYNQLNDGLNDVDDWFKNSDNGNFQTNWTAYNQIDKDNKLSTALRNIRRDGATVEDQAEKLGLDKDELNEYVEQMNAYEYALEMEDKYGGKNVKQLLNEFKKPKNAASEIVEFVLNTGNRHSLGEFVSWDNVKKDPKLISQAFEEYAKDNGMKTADVEKIFNQYYPEFEATGNINREFVKTGDNGREYYVVGGKGVDHKLSNEETNYLFSRVLETGSIEDLKELQDTLPRDSKYTPLRASLREKIEDKEEDKYYHAQKEFYPDDLEDTISAAEDGDEDAKKRLETYERQGFDLENYTKYEKRYLDRLKNNLFQTAVSVWSKDNPVPASLASIPLGTVGSIADVPKVFRAAFDDDYYYDPKGTFNYAAQNIRGTVSEQIDDPTGEFLYNTGMSMADSAVGMAANAIPVAGQFVSGAMFFSSAGVSAANRVIENGGSTGQAAWTMIAHGAAELVFEKVSIGALMDTIESTGKAGVRKLVKDVLKNAFVEGSEEVATSMCNLITDQIINGDLSELSQAKQKYIDEGMSEEEANGAAVSDWWQGLGMDFAGGAVSGGLFGVGGSAINSVQNAVQNTKQNNKQNTEWGNELKNSEGFDLNYLVENGLKSDSAATVKLAENIDKQLKQGKSTEDISAKLIGKLQTQLQSETENNYKELMNELSNNEKNIFTKIQNGSVLSKADLQVVDNSPNLKRAISDFTGYEPEDIKSVDFDEKRSNQEKFKASDNGKTFVNDKEFTGGIEISSVDPRTGTITYDLNYADGTSEQLTSDKIRFATPEEAQLNERAASYNTDQARAFVENYHEGQDVDNYAREWNLYSNYGRLAINLDIEKMNVGGTLTNAQKIEAYQQGLNSRIAHNQAQTIVESVNGLKPYTSQIQGTFTYNVPSSVKLTKAQTRMKNFFRDLSVVTGLNIEIFQSQTDADGYYIGEQGSHDSKTNTLRVDINAGLNYKGEKKAYLYSMLNTLAHELTHVAKQGGKYENLREAIIAALGTTETKFNELVEEKYDVMRKNKKYDKLSDKKLMERADEEVICESCETMLHGNSDFFENLYKKDKKHAKNFVDAIKRLVERVKSFVTNRYANTEYGKALLQVADDLYSQIQQLWNEAVESGLEAANARKAENEGVKYSDRERLSSNRLFDELSESGKQETIDILTQLSKGNAVPLEQINALELFQNAFSRRGELNETINNNTAQRQQLRKEILNKIEKLGSVVEKNGKVEYNGDVRREYRADIVIGLPSAGKSSVLVEPISATYGSRIVDSDIVKESLPEFNNGLGAGNVHVESKKINAQILANAREKGENIVLPIVGSEVNKVLKIINNLKDNGYDVYLHLNELPMYKALGRMITRYIETGRFLEPELIYEYKNKPTNVYEYIINQEGGLLSGYSKYSNDVEYRERPIFKGGTEDIYTAFSGRYRENLKTSGENLRDRRERFSEINKPQDSKKFQDRDYSVEPEEYGDLFDDLFTDDGDLSFGEEADTRRAESIIDKMIEYDAENAAYFLSYSAGEIAQNTLNGLKDIELSDSSYLKIAKRFYKGSTIRMNINSEEIAEQVKLFVGLYDDGMFDSFDSFLSQIVRWNEQNVRSDRFASPENMLANAYNLISLIAEEKASYANNVGEMSEKYAKMERASNKAKAEVKQLKTENQELNRSLSGQEDLTDYYRKETYNSRKEIANLQMLNKQLEKARTKAEEQAERRIERTVERYNKKLDKQKLKASEQKAAALDRMRERYEKLLTAEKTKAKDQRRADHDKVVERYEKKIAELKEKAEQQKRDIREDRDTKLIAAKDKRQADLKALRDNRDKKEYVRKIKKIAFELQQWALHPTDKHFVPQEFLRSGFYQAVNDITEALIISDNTQIAAKLRKIAAGVIKLQGEAEFKYDIDPVIAAEMNDLANAIDGRKINRDLTLRQAEDIYRALRTIKDSVVNARKLIFEGETKDVVEAGVEIINEQKQINPALFNRSLNNVKKFFLTPERIHNIINGYNEGSTLDRVFQGVKQGIRKKNNFYMGANKMFDVYRDAHVKELDQTQHKVREIKWTDNAGHERTTKMTGMQAMQLVMTWNREAADSRLAHIKKGGASILGAEELAKGNLKKAYENRETVLGINESFITNVQKSLTEFERGYIDIAEQFFNGMAKDAINEVSMILRHFETATSEYYIPIKVDDAEIVKEIEGVKQDSSIENMGMLKSVVPYSDKSVLIQGLDNVINKHIDNVGNYYGLAIPIRNMNKVLNVSDTVRDSDGSVVSRNSVKKSLEKNWGKLGTDIYEQLLIDLQNSRAPSNERMQGINNLVRKIRSNFVTATLNGNISVTIKQAASYSTAGVYLDQTSLMKGSADMIKFLKGNLQALFDEIDSHTAQHYIRRKGLSSNEIADIQQSWLKTSKLGRNINNSKLMQKMPAGVNPTNWIQEMDCMTTAALWCATKEQINKQYKKSGKQIDTDEYWQDVTNLYDKVIEDTQPMYDAMHRPEILKSSSELIKSVFMFKTQPLQNAGIIYDAVGRVMQDKKDKAAWKQLRKGIMSQGKSLLVFAGMSLFAAFVLHRMDRYRDEDDEVTAQSIWDTFIKDVIQNGAGVVFPFGGNEGAGAIINTIDTGKLDFSSVMKDNVAETVTGFFGAGADLVNTINEQLGSDDPDTNKIATAAEKFTITWVSDIFGVPVKNAKNIIKGGVDWAEDIVDGGGIFKPDVSDMKAKQIIHSYQKHFENGETDTANSRIQEYYDLKLQSAKDKGKSDLEKEARNAVRDAFTDYYKERYKKAFKENNTAELERIRKILVSQSKYLVWKNTPLSEKLREWQKEASKEK